jgi:hypothetical protein
MFAAPLVFGARTPFHFPAARLTNFVSTSPALKAQVTFRQRAVAKALIHQANDLTKVTPSKTEVVARLQCNQWLGSLDWGVYARKHTFKKRIFTH